jgi:hypothetical protein
MKIKTLELGTMVRDSISNTEGMLTHLMIQIGETREYIYQPRGLNPKTGAPVKRIAIAEERIQGANTVEIDAPLDVLCSHAEDIASGFNGKVISLIYHINGCLHVEIKPEGVLPTSGDTIDAQEFDIRRVKGEKITPLNADQLKKSIAKIPSPSPMPDRLSR